MQKKLEKNAAEEMSGKCFSPVSFREKKTGAKLEGDVESSNQARRMEGTGRKEKGWTKSPQKEN